MDYTYKLTDPGSIDFTAPLFFTVGDIFDWMEAYTRQKEKIQVKVVEIDNRNLIVKCARIQ